MIALSAALLTLILQAPPAAAPQQAPKATVSGIVLNAKGEPLPNIRVTLGRLGVNLGPFSQMVAGDHPPRETTISAEAFAVIREQIASESETGGLRPGNNSRAAAFQAIPMDDISEITVTPTGMISVVSRSTPPVFTDAQGRFSFTADAGSYKLSFSASGYAKVDYGQRTPNSSGIPLSLAPGQSKADIVMHILGVGAVSGRLRDNTGQPAAGVPVQLFRFTFDQTGQRNSQRVAITKTNDLGEYRMYYLTPGRYYLSAGTPPGTNPNLADSLFSSGVGYTSPNRVLLAYAQTYYPGVAKESEAVPVEVPSGGDLRGVDLFVGPQQTYRVRGRVVDSRTGQPPPNASISMVIQNLDPSGIGSAGIGNANYKAVDGSFELRNVSAGAYVISASVPRPAQNQLIDFNSMSPAERQEFFRAQQAEDLTRPKASLPLTVLNSDVDGVVLSLGLNGSISGRLRAEPGGADAAPSLDFFRVLLGPDTPTSFIEGGPQPRPVRADGTFRIENIRPAEYRVVVLGMPAGYYLKEAKVGETDVLNSRLRYSGGDSPVLDLVISPNVGALDGTTDPGAQVVLIPSPNRERTELFRPVTADSSGHFAIPGVAPGEYILAAWEALEPFAFFDPNLIRQAEGQGKLVRVTESAKLTVNVTAIK